MLQKSNEDKQVARDRNAKMLISGSISKPVALTNIVHTQERTQWEEPCLMGKHIAITVTEDWASNTGPITS